MKHFTVDLRFLSTFVLVLLAIRSNAQTDSIILKSMDSVNISLLTCGPDDNVYSLYGHTAIRYHDIGRDQDLVINYGMFSFQKRFFVVRFVFGLTDYEMGIDELPTFVSNYAARGRWVCEQQLNLTREEKWAITQAIDVNYRPENKVYRYNYFYDNCTTRARDMITRHIRGTVLYAENKSITSSYRTMVHQWTAGHVWARFGNDLLLGVKADRKTNKAQQQFLPDTLRRDFEQAIVVDRQGKQRKLVDTTFYLVAPVASTAQAAHPITPTHCVLVLLATTLFVCLAERKTGRILWGYDAVLMLCTGLAGIILLAMVFSQHPTVRLNFQILLLSPLSLVFLYPCIKQLRKHKRHPYIKLWHALLCLFLGLSFFQHYAEGMMIVALSLLIRHSWLMLFTSKLNKR